MGPLEVSKPWNMAGVTGVSRFLERLWAISEKPVSEAKPGSEQAGGAELQKLLHRTIEKVTKDTSTLNFNTAISAMMIYSSELVKLNEIPRSMWEPLVQMSGVYAPHLGEELWEKLGHKESISKSQWPSFDPALTVFDEVTIVVQVGGKIREKFTAAAGTAKEELEKTALALPGTQKWLEGQTIAKIITVADKLVNIVLK